MALTQVGPGMLAPLAVGAGTLQAVALDTLRGDGTGGIVIPGGNTGLRPTGAPIGTQRWNTDLGLLEFFDGSAWRKVSQQPPSFNTASGSLGSRFTTQAGTFNISVTSDIVPTFSITAGSLPAGMALSNGSGSDARISGTVTAGSVPDYSANTVYTFTVRATAAGLTNDRSFSITVNSRFVGFSCSTAGEGGTCADTAPGGFTFVRVDFSSYGTPNGSCGGFSIGGCNAGSSNGYNPTPTTSYSVGANNGTWGDPCGGVGKRMYIQMSYGPFPL
jgi:hypothetical protein